MTSQLLYDFRSDSHKRLESLFGETRASLDTKIFQEQLDSNIMPKWFLGISKLKQVKVLALIKDYLQACNSLPNYPIGDNSLEFRMEAVDYRSCYKNNKGYIYLNDSEKYIAARNKLQKGIKNLTVNTLTTV